MTLRFHPRLINPPFGDPGLLISFLLEKRAVLFDAGDISSLSSRDILKISHIFVSHAHMDHFFGFDRALRLFLGRQKALGLFGPKGIIQHVEGKLAGYSWNLTSHYANRLIVTATEVDGHERVTQSWASDDRFVAKQPPAKEPFSGVLLSEPGFVVRSEELDHGIVSLGFSLDERFHIQIKKEALHRLGLEPGPWINEFKEALFAGAAPDALISVQTKKKPGEKSETIQTPLGRLSEKIALITPGQRIAYITDAVFSDANKEKMIRLAKGADCLFIESPFLDGDADMAKKKRHLTARQAGWIAGKAGVKRLELFHFSPRYSGMEDQIQNEARAAFERFGGPAD